MRFAALIIACLTLASCARNEIIMPLAVADKRVADVRAIHVATLRGAGADGLSPYSGERGKDLSFGRIDVSIPRDREAGTIVYPRIVPNLKEQFAATGYVTGRDERQFVAAIDRQLAALPADQRSVFVFVHGYNTNFAAGVYRQAQMFHDFGFSGVAVNFSWASAGSTPLYLYDRDSAQLARNGLRRTLIALTKSKGKSIMLVAHSMGGLVTMETLRDIGLRGEKKLLKRIDTLVLASPDVDPRVFREQLSHIDPLPQPFVIFVSRRDRALLASQTLRGGQERIGEGGNIEELQKAGITVIDLTDVSDGQDATHHTTFATSKTLFSLAKSGAFSRKALLGQGQRKADPLKPIGDGLGAITDLAATIVYLPARIAGVR